MTRFENKLQIIVAAWGPAFGYPCTPAFGGEQFATQGPTLAYEMRTKVAISALPSTELGEVIDQAAAEFGVFSRTERSISEQVPCLAFFQEGDQGGMAGGPDRWNRALRTADAEGVPSWPVHWSEIRLEELLETSAAGLLDGEPLRPYFWPVIPQGVLADVASSILTTWGMWEHYLSARETSAIVRRILERIRRGRTAVEADRAAWGRWLRKPQILMPYLDSTPRTTAQIAADTGISEATLEGALWGMGYAMGDDHRWRLSDDSATQILRAGVTDIKNRGHGPHDLTEAAHRVQSLVERAENTSTRSLDTRM